MDRPRTLVGTLVLGFVLTASAIGAQTLAVKPGDIVWRTDSAGQQSTGVVQRIESSALTVRVNGQERQWPVAEMRELWREGDSLRNGAILGALIGMGAGVAGGVPVAMLYENEGGDGARPLFIMAALGTGAGLGIGIGFDALFRGRTLVYRQRAAPVVARPILSNDRRGVQLAVRF
jgi:hypothetical protein